MIATSLEAALVILTLEFGLLAVAIAFFSYRGVRTAEAETVADATALVSKVSNTEESRRTALETVFRDKYQYEGEELAAAADEFMQREKAFYNAVVGAFLGRGKSKISDLNDELTKVVAPWISITPKKMLDAEAAESLAAEKSGLETELAQTKQILDKMMVEYNRAFRIDPSGQPAADEPASTQIDTEMDGIESIDDDLSSIDLGPDAAQSSNDGAAGSNPPDEDTAAVATAIIEDPDDQPEADAVAETPVDRAEKPMTADDLDDLMESLESEPETATAG